MTASIGVDILVEYVQHVDVHMEDGLDVEVLGERWDVLSELVIGFNYWTLETRQNRPN